LDVIENFLAKVATLLYLYLILQVVCLHNDSTPLFVYFNYFEHSSYCLLLLNNPFVLTLMDPLVNYLDFAIQRAVGLYEQLDKSKITLLNFVSDFFNNCEFYKSLNTQKYNDAQPSFIFCGLIHKACTILIEKGEDIERATYDLLITSSKAVRIMVLLIDKLVST
jgi:hypothetical protein